MISNKRNWGVLDPVSRDEGLPALLACLLVTSGTEGGSRGNPRSGLRNEGTGDFPALSSPATDCRCRLSGKRLSVLLYYQGSPWYLHYSHSLSFVNLHLKVLP